MEPTRHIRKDVEGQADAGNKFTFISIQSPDEVKDRSIRRLVRSHAVSQGIQRKRRQKQQSAKAESGPGSEQRAVWRQQVAPSQFTLSLSAFERLAAETAHASKLKTLLSHYGARQATEPVFSVADDVVFQGFHSVFRTGLEDPALLAALMLTFTLATTGGSIHREFIDYQNLAMHSIRQTLSSPNRTTSATTLGAILLLAGVEARLGMRQQVQLHMSAILQLLETSRTEHVHLTDGIKRAVFWQDLNSSVLTGSTRIVDHATFAELHWRRDPFSPQLFTLPPGFKALSDLFTADFIEVLEDIHALQCIRDSPGFECEDTVAMTHVDNHQASIESRIVGLPKLALVVECCYLAAYLCACMLCCKVWRKSIIPPHLSSQLLTKIQQADDGVWYGHQDLLIWLLYMGGAFAATGSTRLGYIQLLRSHLASASGGSDHLWPKLLQIFEQFIWSHKAYEAQVKAFWEEAHGS